MKRSKILVPFLASALLLAGCGGGGGDGTPEWAKQLVEDGYTYSKAAPSDEEIAEALGLEEVEFFDFSNIITSGYAYKFLEATDDSYQCFNIYVEGEVSDALVEYLGDYGWDVYEGLDYYGYLSYYWCLDGDRDVPFELDISWAFEDETAAEPYATTLTIYKASDLWSTELSEATDWTEDDKVILTTYFGDLEIPFLAMGADGAWTNNYYDDYGCISYEDYCWYNKTAEYEDLLEDAGFEKVVDPDYGTYFTKSDAVTGDGVEISVYFSDSTGNTIDIYPTHKIVHEGTEADPYTVADALTKIYENYNAEVTDDTVYYVTGVVSASVAPKTGTSGDYQFYLIDEGKTDELFIYYVHPNGYKIPTAGEAVTVAGTLTLYEKNETYTPEMNSGNMVNGTPLVPTRVVLDKQTLKILPGESKKVNASLDYEPETPTFSYECEQAWITVTIAGKEITIAIDAGATVGATGTVTIKSGELEPATVTVTVLDPEAGGGVEEETHTLIVSSFGITESGKSYIDVTHTADNGIKYVGQMMQTPDFIQIRSKNSNSGIVVSQNETGLVATKITIHFNSTTTNTNSVNIYGADSAFGIANMYGNDTVTKIGTITTSSTSLTIEGGYSFIGIRSANGAFYIDSIEIEWTIA